MSPKTKLAVLAAIVVIAIAVVIALNPGTSDENGSDQGHVFPDPIEEGDRDYPAAPEAEESYAETIETLKSSLSDPSLSADDMADSIETAAGDYLKMLDYYAWVNLDYNKKPTEFADTYTAWTELRSRLYDDLAIALKESLSGPCAETAGKAMEACGLDPEEYRNYEEMTQEEKDFKEREADLIAEYNNLMYGDYEMEYGGVIWTAESIQDDITLTDAQKESLMWLLQYHQGEDAAEIYVELVQIRNDYAVLKGYDNYSIYAYEAVYGRDYTLADARSFSDLVDTALDIYADLSEAQSRDSSMSLDRLSWMDDYEGDGFIDLVSPFIDSISDEYAKLLDYMTEYGLIDIYSEAGRQEGAYSQELYNRGSALMYVGYAGDGYPGYLTAKTVVHEYGHVANICLNPNSTSCLDIDEIHSQGLEALYCASGSISEGSRALAAYILSSIINSDIVMPGLLTELELWAYETEAETGSLTGNQVRDEFISILESHGYNPSIASYNCYLWTKIPHLFKAPHYYISYGTSAIGAIELFVEATEDYDAAKEKYLGLVFQQGIDGYSEAVKEAGLTSAFDTDAAKAILEECITALQRVKA